MLRNLRSQLREAIDSGHLSRIWRSVDTGSDQGYVVAVGPAFFLTCVLSDEIWFNGFKAFRLQDISRLEAPNEFSDFIQMALKLRAQERPANPEVSLVSLPQLLLSASDQFPLVTIHMEVADPEVCYIGKVKGVTERVLTLHGIDPHAEWHEEASEYELSDITRIDFGGGYEDALWRVSESMRQKKETA